jgi:hypothetical protein
MPAVVVKKSGLFSALFHGLFGFLTAVVLCATGLGFYGLHIVDETASGLFSLGDNLIQGLPQWKEALPPMLAEALNDRRDPGYRSELDIAVQTVSSRNRHDRPTTVIEVSNNGSETVTVLALNVVLEDENGVPVGEFRTYAATPLTVDEGDWRGPLLPGSTRKFTERCCGHGDTVRATIEVAELRVWNEQEPVADADATTS